MQLGVNLVGLVALMLVVLLAGILTQVILTRVTAGRPFMPMMPPARSDGTDYCDIGRVVR